MYSWPPWFVIAQAEELLHVREIPGPRHNERILMYHDETRLDASTDEVPWCSAFANFCIRKCGMGLAGTFSARARSWLESGTALSIPAIGCITILKRGGDNQPGPEVIQATGHVGFFAGQPSPSMIQLLGGNQSDRVCYAQYPVHRVLGYRWPVLPTP